MKKAFIFDLDGVICFTDKYHYSAWKSLADKLNIPFDEKVNDRLRGVSRMASLEIILEKSSVEYTQEQKEAFATEKNEKYRTLLNNMSPADISDDVRDTLVGLKNKGFKLAIGSSSKNTPLILEKTDTAGYFDAVADGNSITHSKPNPEVFLKAAELLNMNPDECYVVEDAEAGIDAGLSGGFTTIGIGPASVYEKTDYPVKKISDILSLI